MSGFTELFLETANSNARPKAKLWYGHPMVKVQSLLKELQMQFEVPPDAVKGLDRETARKLAMVMAAYIEKPTEITRRKILEILKCGNIPSSAGHLQQNRDDYARSVEQKDADELAMAIQELTEKYGCPFVSAENVDGKKKIIRINIWVFTYEVNGQNVTLSLYDEETGVHQKIFGNMGQAIVEFEHAVAAKRAELAKQSGDAGDLPGGDTHPPDRGTEKG